MKKTQLVFLSFFLILFMAGGACHASSGYEKSISIGGENDVEYDYKEYSEPEIPNYETNTNSNRSIMEFSPYKRYPNYYNNYGYNNYGGYYSGMPLVFTYSSTGIKTGPDGRMITPLMERELYKYYNRPAPPPPPPPRHAPPPHRPPHH